MANDSNLTIEVTWVNLIKEKTIKNESTLGTLLKARSLHLVHLWPHQIDCLCCRVTLTRHNTKPLSPML